MNLGAGSQSFRGARVSLLPAPAEGSPSRLRALHRMGKSAGWSAGLLCVWTILALSGCLGDETIPNTQPGQDCVFNIRMEFTAGAVDEGSGADRSRWDIEERQETDKDCGPTALRMWLKYYRNIAYRAGWLLSDDENLAERHYDSITRKLDDYAETLCNGQIESEYDTASGYVYPSSAHGTEVNCVDWVKWCFGTNDIYTDFWTYGTFLLHCLIHDTDIPGNECHLIFTAEFMGYLIEKLYFNAFRFEHQLGDFGLSSSEVSFDDDRLAELWESFARCYPYPEDWQMGDVHNHELGIGTYCDFIVDEDPATFLSQVFTWIRYLPEVDQYAQGDNFVDRGLIVLTQDTAGTDYTTLHFALVTGVNVFIPAGQVHSWSNAQITYRIADPWEGPKQYTQSEMELLVRVIDYGNGNKLLTHRCIGLYLGEKNFGRYSRGVKLPEDIALADADARAAYYGKNYRENVARRILPILMLLEEE